MSKKILLVQNNTIYSGDANSERFRDTFVMLERKAKAQGGTGVSDVQYHFVPHPTNHECQSLVAIGRVQNDYSDTDVFC